MRPTSHGVAVAVTMVGSLTFCAVVARPASEETVAPDAVTLVSPYWAEEPIGSASTNPSGPIHPSDGGGADGVLMDGGACEMQPPLDSLELARVLYEGHVAYFGRPPTHDRLACAWGHCALEHARGAELFGNNLGHITTTGAWGGPYCVREFTIRVARRPDRWERQAVRFRIHRTLLEGAIDYWRLIGRQYPTVLDLCDRGDALEAARELRRRGYFTYAEEPYAQAMQRLFLEGSGTIVPRLDRPLWTFRRQRAASP